uniref:Uncharacterized protein n=1 Tax=Setaria viridis TaxID=4556 RepID=A0A4U6TNY0_SETVI|nr:hypothetical protein SEVIR_8G235101v2 [Setaria viridis]
MVACARGHQIKLGMPHRWWEVRRGDGGPPQPRLRSQLNHRPPRVSPPLIPSSSEQTERPRQDS